LASGENVLDLSNKRRLFRQLAVPTMSAGYALGRNLDKTVKGRKNAAKAAFYKALPTEKIDKLKGI
jgi:hypothetical protein